MGAGNMCLGLEKQWERPLPRFLPAGLTTAYNLLSSCGRDSCHQPASQSHGILQTPMLLSQKRLRGCLSFRTPRVGSRSPCPGSMAFLCLSISTCRTQKRGGSLVLQGCSEDLPVSKLVEPKLSVNKSPLNSRRPMMVLSKLPLTDL